MARYNNMSDAVADGKKVRMVLTMDGQTAGDFVAQLLSLVKDLGHKNPDMNWTTSDANLDTFAVDAGAGFDVMDGTLIDHV